VMFRITIGDHSTMSLSSACAVFVKVRLTSSSRTLSPSIYPGNALIAIHQQRAVPADGVMCHVKLMYTDDRAL
jgi:hypothetical protein